MQVEPKSSDWPTPSPHTPQLKSVDVTLRSFALGLALTTAFAAFNSWLTIQLRVNFFGGVQMPFGAIFVLLGLILFINVPLRFFRAAWPHLQRIPGLGRVCAPLEPAELLVIYVMMIFGALLSTPGCDNFFLTTGSGLFYFSTRENQWAETFYHFIPSHFAPGWDGHTYQQEVIEPLYLGGLSFSQVPWHAWTAMLIGWSVLLVLLYSVLFFTAVILRRQWIEAEALTFPLLLLPLQMVDAVPDSTSSGSFWTNRSLWAGTALAAGLHLFRGLNANFPDWPLISTFQGNSFGIQMTEAPWNSMGSASIELFLGVIGIAFLLTRELSFSFWFFFLTFKLQLLASTLIGYPANTLPRDTHLGNPTFIAWQSTGAWLMMAALLLWNAGEHIRRFCSSSRSHKSDSDEPFHPQFVIGGLFISAAGLLFWCWFSGVNLVAAASFFAVYLLMSIVIARLVVEGGFLYPQITFAPLEALTGSLLSTQTIGAASLAKLSFTQPMLFFDMRTNLLPVFLHTLKLAHVLGMERRQVRRFVLCAATATIVALVVSSLMTIAMLYRVGGLASNVWFVQHGPQRVFRGTAELLSSQPDPAFANWGWMAVGGAVVWLLTFARARFLWFPLHPLAYLVGSGSPIAKMWPSFFIGWLIKTLLLKFGGQEASLRVRPFMIGLILGNATAMVLWTLFGLLSGTQISYWPG